MKSKPLKEAMKASGRCCSLNNCLAKNCEGIHFLIKLQALHLELYPPGDPKEVYFRTAYKTPFCSKSSFAEHHPRTASKAKYETVIYNFIKCCSSHEKIELILNLFTIILVNKKIKQAISYYEVNPFSVFYHNKNQGKLQPRPQSNFKKILLAPHYFARNFFLI